MSFNPMGDPRATEPGFEEEPTCESCGAPLGNPASNRCSCWEDQQQDDADHWENYEDFRDAPMDDRDFPDFDEPSDFERGF